jgi:uncharacterized protein YndB with AHSA1/START domain
MPVQEARDMPQDRITVETLVDAPIGVAWKVYIDPAYVMQWNFASDDWHCPSANADLRDGGKFVSRMEARDGSMGFDFEGTYTKVIENELIDYSFGDRTATVEFLPSGDKALVRVSFEPENEYPLDQQRCGWQSILDNYARHASSQ